MKKYLFTVILMALCLTGYSQIYRDLSDTGTDSLKLRNVIEFDNFYTANLPKVTLPSPQAMLFEKYLNHQISEYTGVPDISIPLYEIELKGMKIPIILNYHASGIKFRQYNGEVGAGWTINVGGYRISRTIYGRPDERFPDRHDQKEFDRLDVAAQNSQNYKRLPFLEREEYLGRFCLSETDYNKSGILSDGNLRDGEYDHYSYQLPTTSGHFICTDFTSKKYETAEQNLDNIVFNTENIPTITDGAGNAYLFAEREYTPDMGLTAVSSWLLSRIRTPYNDEVKLSFVTEKIYRPQPISLSISDATVYNDVKISANSYAERKVHKTNYSDLYQYDYNNMKFLDSIQTSQIIIKFIREVEINETNVSELIKEIQIKTRSGEILKTINLEYKASPEDATICIGGYWCNSSDPYQILLKSVSIGEDETDIQKYEFVYNEPKKEDLKKCFPDEWGYYKFPITYWHSEINSYPVLHKEFMNDLMLHSNSSGAWNIQTAPIGGNDGVFENRSMDSIWCQSYILKKIVFPTGGYTEYEYEANRYKSKNKDATLGGGLRVKKIVSHTDLTSEPVISHFRYGTGENGIGISRGNIEEIDYKRGFSDVAHSFHYEDNGGMQIFNFNGYKTLRTYSTNPIFADFELYSQIFYPEVSIYQYDEKNKKYLGKTVSKYKNLQNLSFGYISGAGGPTFTGSWSQYNPPINDSKGLATSIYKLGQEPLLDSKEYYDNEKLVSAEYYFYDKKTAQKEFKGFFVTQNVTFSNYSWHNPDGWNNGESNPFDLVYTQFRYGSNSVNLGRSLLSSKKIIEKSNSGEINSEEFYDYDDKNRTVKTRKTNSINGTLVQDFTYPDLNTHPGLVNKNMVSTVMETKTKHNELEIGNIINVYKKDDIFPQSVQTSSGGEFRTDITYDKYDSRGNILQYTTLDGVSTSYLWSYNGQYPIAELKNTTYDQIKEIIGESSINSITEKIKPDDSDWTLIKGLQTDDRLKNSLVTVYTYKPLVGIETITDPRGVVTTYEYDNFGRLKWIKDSDGNLIEEYKYHYREENK